MERLSHGPDGVGNPRLGWLRGILAEKQELELLHVSPCPHAAAGTSQLPFSHPTRDATANGDLGSATSCHTLLETVACRQNGTPRFPSLNPPAIILLLL